MAWHGKILRVNLTKSTSQSEPLNMKWADESGADQADAVRLVLAGGRTIPQVAQELDLTETALRNWVRSSKSDAEGAGPNVLTTDERDELTRLRRDVKRLEMERDILKKATAFFARETR